MLERLFLNCRACLDLYAKDIFSLIFNNEVDVVVTDGFTGNVVLKTSESLYKMLKELVKEEVKRKPLRMISAFLFQGTLKAAKNRLDPDKFGGAPLLGLRGNVLKALLNQVG